MMNINLNGILIQVIEDILKSGDNKVCIDFDYPKIKESFFKRADNAFYLSNGRHTWIQSKTELQFIGDYWEQLSKNNKWGGNFKNFTDTPHFERRLE